MPDESSLSSTSDPVQLADAPSHKILILPVRSTPSIRALQKEYSPSLHQEMAPEALALARALMTT
jgi:hypothetical protein